METAISVQPHREWREGLGPEVGVEEVVREIPP
jgi:hypothetical protein